MYHILYSDPRTTFLLKLRRPRDLGIYAVPLEPYPLVRARMVGRHQHPLVGNCLRNLEIAGTEPRQLALRAPLRRQGYLTRTWFLKIPSWMASATCLTILGLVLTQPLSG